MTRKLLSQSMGLLMVMQVSWPADELLVDQLPAASVAVQELIAQIQAEQSDLQQHQAKRAQQAAPKHDNQELVQIEAQFATEFNTDSLNYVPNQLAKVYQDPALTRSKVSLHSNPAEVQVVLESLSKSAGLDFLIDSSIKGQIGKLALKNCTPGHALEFICTHSNPQLAIVKDQSGVFRVMPRSEAERYLESLAGLDKIAFEPIKVTYADFSQNFMKNCEAAWSKIAGQTNTKAHIYFDADHKKVLVRGSLREVLEFKQFLNGLDKPIQQIRIDAILLFASKNYEYEFGINWSGIYNRQNSVTAKNKPFGFYGVGGTLTDFPEPTQPVGGSSSNTQNLYVNPANFAINLFNHIFTPSTPAQDGETYLFVPFVFGGSDINKRRLNLTLNAAEDQSKVKIVSRPSILTNNNQQAIIYIGQQLPMKTTTVDNSGDTPTRTTTIKYQPVGITLKVTPTVSADKRSIQLSIDLEETDVTTGTTQANAQGIMQNPPQISIISVKNNVILKNGQTTVIGGLTKNNDTKSNNRIPVLHKLPLVGRLFQADFLQNTEVEQFIFITPTIVENAPL